MLNTVVASMMPDRRCPRLSSWFRCVLAISEDSKNERHGLERSEHGDKVQGKDGSKVGPRTTRHVRKPVNLSTQLTPSDWWYKAGSSR
jgi:hypothetical protein